MTSENLNPNSLKKAVSPIPNVSNSQELIQVEDQDVITRIDTSILDQKHEAYIKEQNLEYQDDLIDKANEQKDIEKQKAYMEREIKKVSNELSPLYDLIFSGVNNLFVLFEIQPFTNEEQGKIKIVIIDWTSSAITGNMERAENFISTTKNFPKYLRLIDLITNVIVPRIIVFATKRKGE